MSLVLVVCLLAAGAVLLWPAGGRAAQVRAGVPRVGEGRAGGVRVGPVPGQDADGVPGDDLDVDGQGWRARVRLLAHRLRHRGASARARSTELALIDGLAAALEAGLPVPRAVALTVGELGLEESGPPGWAGLARAAAEGQELAPAWQRLARQTRSPALGSVARAWRVASLTGAPLASALRVSAHTARERHRLIRAVEVATAGPRATVGVLTLLPLAGVGLAAVLGVGPTTLYGHPIAQASAGTGALLILAGQVWVRRMVAGVTRSA